MTDREGERGDDTDERADGRDGTARTDATDENGGTGGTGGTGETDPADEAAGVDGPRGAHGRNEEDPSSRLDGAEPRPEDDTFERMEGTDAAEVTAPAEGEAGEAVVPKHTYCERCEHFSEPPETACTHEGTEILELVDVDHFRVVDCPVVAWRRGGEEFVAGEARPPDADGT